MEMSDKSKKPAPERSHKAMNRKCLMCQDEFESSWSGERVCKRCKSSNTWRSGTDYEAA